MLSGLSKGIANIRTEMTAVNDIDRAEKYILVAVATGDEEGAWDSLDELADLLETAGGETICQVVQNLVHLL